MAKSLKMQLAGKKAALSKIERFANSTDEQLAAEFKPQAEKLRGEIAAILEEYPQLAVTATQRRRSDKPVNPRRAAGAKSAHVTMKKLRLESETDPKMQAKLREEIASLEHDIAEMRRLFPEIGNVTGKAESLSVDDFQAAYKSMDGAMQAEIARILGGGAPAAPAEPVELKPKAKPEAKKGGQKKAA